MKSTITNETQIELRKMYLDGLEPYVIAEELDIGISTVYKYLNKFKLLNRKSSISLDDQDRILKLWYDGISAKEIIRAYNLSHFVFYSFLMDCGIDISELRKSEYIVHDAIRERAVKMYKEGWKISAITKATGVNAMQLNRELHKRGVPLRRNNQIIMPYEETETELLENEQ